MPTYKARHRKSTTRRLGTSHQRCLELIAGWAGRKSGTCRYKSVEAIAAAMGISRRWAQQLLRDLEAAGRLETAVGGGRRPADRYRAAVGLVSEYRPLAEANSDPRIALQTREQRSTDRPSQGENSDPRIAPSGVKRDDEGLDDETRGKRFASAAASAPESVGGERIASPAGSAPVDVSTARVGPTRQAAGAAAPLRSAPSGDGSPSRAAPEGVDFAAAKSVQPPTEIRRHCGRCDSFVKADGSGHAPRCEQGERDRQAWSWRIQTYARETSAAWHEAFGGPDTIRTQKSRGRARS